MTNKHSKQLPDAPRAQRREHKSYHHNHTLIDAYAWLQDPEYPRVNDPDILAYLEAENRYFESHMDKHKDNIEALFTELKARQKLDDESVPYFEAGTWYQWAFNKAAQYRTWSRWKSGGDNNKQVFLDENLLAEGLEYFHLGGFDICPNGSLLAWSDDTDGSEQYRISFKNLDTGQVLDDRIPDTFGTPVWANDNKTVFYVVLNENWRPYQIRAHVVGEPIEGDHVVYTEEDEAFFVDISVSQSNKFLFISSGDHVTSEVRFLSMDEPKAEPLIVTPRRTKHEYSVDHGGKTFFITTNRNQKNFSVMYTPETNPDESNWQVLVEGNARHYIRGILPLKNHLIIQERIEGLDAIRILSGELSSAMTETYIKFPEATFHAELGTNPEFDSDLVRISYESMLTPPTVMEYHLDSAQLTVRKTAEIPSGYTADEFCSERLMIEARDGVSVPVSIVYPKGFELGGNSPLYLYAYGAYGYATPPGFSTTRLSLLNRGFAYAIAHIRGGDDLGYQWYEDGKLDKRTNTFNDFVDVAQGLIARGYTRAGKIAIAGGSAGGELVAAVTNQAPELWGAVVAHVPFVDVLNTMLNKDLPLTPMEWPEWGNPVEDPQAYTHILSYSPYDQIEEKDYPPMMVTAGLNDPRVTYWEPAKYVAKLRHLKTDKNLLVLKTNMGAGHGGKSGRFDALYETAEEFIFVMNALDRSLGQNQNP